MSTEQAITSRSWVGISSASSGAGTYFPRHAPLLRLGQSDLPIVLSMAPRIDPERPLG